MLKYINTWKLNKAQSNFLYFVISLCFLNKPIKKGDKIKCYGIGYPHWKNDTFECSNVFDDGTILIRDCIRVVKNDFKVIK